MDSSHAPIEDVLDAATRNVGDVLHLAIEHPEGARALVVHDRRSALAATLAEAYRRNLTGAEFIDFDQVPPERILAAFETLARGDLVVLVQSTSFRLDAFRIRLELFARGLAVVEHPHLERMHGPQAAVYVDALAYDPGYYRVVGPALKARIDACREAVVDSHGARLVYPSGLEPAKLNIGDYRAMKNVGGQFPIGEVFTESRDLEAVHGEVRIAFFGDTRFNVHRPRRPALLRVQRGRVVDVEDSDEELDRVLAAIAQDEGQVWLRELGLGLNRAFTSERTVCDIGSFERMCGVHLSLGAKHASYAQPQVKKRRARHHVDVFVHTSSVSFDGAPVFGSGQWFPGGAA